MVFPTRVGMNRLYWGSRLTSTGVPHASGDEPDAGDDGMTLDECSPREWG